MLDTLAIFLADSAPHISDQIYAAFKLFDRIGLANYTDEYNDAMMVSDNVDVSDTTDRIINTTLDLQENILRAHEVILVDDVTIPTQTLFINAILDIQVYGDVKTLLQTASLETDLNDVFSEIISLVTHLNSTELFAYIEYVSPAFISNVKEFCEDIPEKISPADVLVRDGYVKKLSQFTSLIKTEDLEIIKLLNAGLDLGYLFNVYVSIFSDELEAKSTHEIACELIASALISSDGTHNPISVIQNSIDTYISDLDIVTKVNIEVTKLLLDLQVDIKGLDIDHN